MLHRSTWRRHLSLHDGGTSLRPSLSSELPLRSIPATPTPSPLLQCCTWMPLLQQLPLRTSSAQVSTSALSNSHFTLLHQCCCISAAPRCCSCSCLCTRSAQVSTLALFTSSCCISAAPRCCYCSSCLCAQVQCR